MLGSIVGGLASGLLGRQGVKAQNRANLQLSREDRLWKENMANTAYQRSAADLEKAGLNRILSLGSPAQTPSHSSPTMQNENESASRAAQAVAMQIAQIKNLNATTAKTIVDTKTKQPMADIMGMLSEHLTNNPKLKDLFTTTITNLLNPINNPNTKPFANLRELPKPTSEHSKPKNKLPNKNTPDTKLQNGTFIEAKTKRRYKIINGKKIYLRD